MHTFLSNQVTIKLQECFIKSAQLFFQLLCLLFFFVALLFIRFVIAVMFLLLTYKRLSTLQARSLESRRKEKLCVMEAMKGIKRQDVIESGVKLDLWLWNTGVYFYIRCLRTCPWLTLTPKSSLCSSGAMRE